MKRNLKDKLTYANVVSTLCLFVLLGGSAYAAISVPRNSVGTRQLKAASVTNGKLANGAVTGAKIAEESITGQNVNLNALGIVPQAANATHASNADTLGTERYTAACPEHTILIRGLCFDSSSNPEAQTVQKAAESCAAKGGWLPSPMQLYSVKGILNLGTGTGTDRQYTDEVYANTDGENYSTVVVDGTGAITEKPTTEPEHYYCVYSLIR